MPGENKGLAVVGHQSFLVPNSRHLMGYDIFDDGFHLRLDRELPKALASEAPEQVRRFLAQFGMTHEDINFWLFHPGGAKILDFLEETFALKSEQARWSRDVLREVGNLSSATILFVLKAFLDSKVAARGDKVLMVGVGPSLTIELILFEWVG
jgi:alkylresorcinol/alkylpyrone synthase